MCRNCFRDCYWGRAGQLLANFFPCPQLPVPEIFTKVNPLSPLSDQCQYSPNSVNTESRGKAMETIKMITKKNCQIVSANSLSKCMEISLVDLNLDSYLGPVSLSFVKWRISYLPPGSVLNSASAVKRSTSMSTSLSCSTTRLGFFARTCTLYIWSGSRLVIVCWNVPGRTVL